MAEESMKDFEKEINESFKTAKKVENEDGGKWERFAELIETKEEFDVKIIEAVKGGCIAYLEDTRGFIPASQLSIASRASTSRSASSLRIRRRSALS